MSTLGRLGVLLCLGSSESSSPEPGGLVRDHMYMLSDRYN